MPNDDMIRLLNKEIKRKLRNALNAADQELSIDGSVWEGESKSAYDDVSRRIKLSILTAKKDLESLR
jgi:uncharacterized protein YukE